MKAQKTLYLRYGPRMMTLCKRYAMDLMEAEDMLQEGFIKVFRNLQSFRGEGSFEGWMRSIMVRTALRYIKKRSLNFPELLLDMKEDPSPDAFDHLSEKDILACIDDLPVGYKTVFNLYVIEGYKHKDIAELLSITENTSRSQLLKARKALQKRMTVLFEIDISTNE